MAHPSLFMAISSLGTSTVGCSTEIAAVKHQVEIQRVKGKGEVEEEVGERGGGEEVEGSTDSWRGLIEKEREIRAHF